MKPENIAPFLKEILRSGRELEGGLYSNPELYDAVYTLDADYPILESKVRQNIEKGSSILYIGCGTGNLIRRLENDYEILGIDRSSQMTDYASEKVDSEIRNKSSFEMDFHEEFDAVIQFGLSLNYILSEREMESHFRKIGEALKEGGVYLADFWTLLDKGSGWKTEYELEGVDLVVGYSFEELEHCMEMEIKFRISSDLGSEKFNNTHRIRSWEVAEIKQILELGGLEAVGSEKLYDHHNFRLVEATRDKTG
ncbi:MAG: class I SAM-dependent methyltransferase [Candidatus Nanohaloarchaea archaeon]